MERLIRNVLKTISKTLLCTAVKQLLPHRQLTLSNISFNLLHLFNAKSGSFLKLRAFHFHHSVGRKNHVNKSHHQQ